MVAMTLFRFLLWRRRRRRGEGFSLLTTAPSETSTRVQAFASSSSSKGRVISMSVHALGLALFLACPTILASSGGSCFLPPGSATAPGRVLPPFPLSLRLSGGSGSGASLQLSPNERRALVACAAEQAACGDPLAMCLQGIMCAEVGSDAQAAGWFELSAAGGCPEAMREMAMVYRHGRGRDVDHGMADIWLLKASRAGNPESMLEMWERGDGDEAGLSLLEAAASAGLAEAQYQMGMLGKGREWLEMAAREGHVMSMLALAERVDGEEGAEWLKRAASTGETHAVMALALRYQIGGGGISEDHERAAELYTLAAERGDAAARVNLGLCYLGGRGVPRDDEKGAMHIVQAAESGFPEAQYILGTLHMRGVANVIRDDVYAFRWFKRGADGGSSNAAEALSTCYGRGIGVEGNETLSMHYKAVSERLREAQDQRGSGGRVRIPAHASQPSWQKEEEEKEEQQVAMSVEVDRAKADEGDDFGFESCWEEEEVVEEEDHEIGGYNEIDRDILCLPTFKADLRRRGRIRDAQELTDKFCRENQDEVETGEEGGEGEWHRDGENFGVPVPVDEW